MNIHSIALASAAMVFLATAALAADANGTGPSSVAVIATSSQKAVVAFGAGPPSLGNNAVSRIDASGLVNLQQNTGANSVLQSENALSTILDCNCSHAGELTSRATSTQNALILGDITVRAPNGVGGAAAGRAGNLSQSSISGAATASNSISGLGSGTGLYNISQNTGTNAVLQSANTVAEIRGSGQVSGTAIVPQ